VPRNLSRKTRVLRSMLRQRCREGTSSSSCVGTPAREDGSANLLAVEKAARTVARFATGPVVV
jgi:UDP-glucose 6-dehydrogenase